MKKFNKDKGSFGEKTACAYLKRAGYQIFHRNYKTDIGEIDIVATNGDALTFIEVKSRTTNDYGYPSDAVNYYKRRKINEVAAQYIKQFRYFDVPVRFDVIEVYLDNGKINHIVNAFDSYLRY